MWLHQNITSHVHRHFDSYLPCSKGMVKLNFSMKWQRINCYPKWKAEKNVPFKRRLLWLVAFCGGNKDGDDCLRLILHGCCSHKMCNFLLIFYNLMFLLNIYFPWIPSNHFTSSFWYYFNIITICTCCVLWSSCSHNIATYMWIWILPYHTII